MATKPTIGNAEWASSTNYPHDASPEQDTPTKVLTTPDQKAYGWRPNEKPPAQDQNAWQFEGFKWFSYISDGDLEGDHTIDGSLAVDGTVSASDSIFAPIVRTDHITPTSGDPLEVETGIDLLDGHYYFEEPLRWSVSPSDFFQQTNTHTPSPIEWIMAASSNLVWCPLKMPVGAMLTEFTWYVNKATDASNEVKVDLHFVSNSGTDTPIGSTASNAANAPGLIGLTQTGLTVPIADFGTYYLVFESDGGITPSADRLRVAEYSWCLPKP